MTMMSSYPSTEKSDFDDPTPADSSTTQIEESSMSQEIIPVVESTENVGESASEATPSREGPGIISITATISPALKKLLISWLLFNHNDESKQILVEPSPVQLTHVFAEEASEHVAQLLETIDLSRSELVSINADTYKDFFAIGQVQERLIGLDGNFAIVFRRIGADEFIKQVIFLKPVFEQDQSNLTPEDNGIDNQVQPSVGDFDGVIPCLRLPKEADASVAVSANRPEEESADNNVENGGVVEEQSGPNNDINTTTTSTITAGSTSSGNVGTELCIGPISDRGTTWQRYSPLEQGDRILSLNGKDDHVADLPSQEAELVIETMYTCSPYLSIVVNTPPSKRKRKGSGWRAKLMKGAVAVGGGTMVGAGRCFHC